MERFLIIRIGGVGDTILLLPFVSALRKTYPEAHLEFIGYPERIQIFKDFGYVDEIKSFDQSGISFLFSSDSEPAQKSTTEYFTKFDTIFAFLNDEEGIFRRSLQRCGVKKLYLFSPYPNGNMHILDYYENLSNSLGLKKINQFENRFLAPSTSPSPLVRRTPYESSDPIGEGEGRNEGKTAVFHPGAGSKKKCWPTKYFAKIINWLAEKYQIGGNHLKTLLISGPADEEITKEVISNLRKMKPEIIKNLNLTELALLLNRCFFYLGNDSGITHLSAFTGIPTIAIFNQENAKTWSPKGENVHLCVSDKLENISPVIIKTQIEKIIVSHLCNPTTCLFAEGESLIRKQVVG